MSAPCRNDIKPCRGNQRVASAVTGTVDPRRHERNVAGEAGAGENGNGEKNHECPRVMRCVEV